MAYIITEPCIGTCDTTCVEVCPVECIEGPLEIDEIEALREQGDDTRLANISMFIDPEECIDCGACEPECPVQAIFIDDEVPSKWTHFIQLNAAFFGHDSP